MFVQAKKMNTNIIKERKMLSTIVIFSVLLHLNKIPQILISFTIPH